MDPLKSIVFGKLFSITPEKGKEDKQEVVNLVFVEQIIETHTPNLTEPGLEHNIPTKLGALCNLDHGNLSSLRALIHIKKNCPKWPEVLSGFKTLGCRNFTSSPLGYALGRSQLILQDLRLFLRAFSTGQSISNEDNVPIPVLVMPASPATAAHLPLASWTEGQRFAFVLKELFLVFLWK